MTRKEKIFSITAASILLAKRMAARTVALALLTLFGFWVVDLLVESGMHDRLALVRRFPEFIPLLVAAAKFTFIEMSLFWIRFATAPKIDVQAAIREVDTWDNQMALAFVYLTNSLIWAFRVCVFIYLVG